MALRGLLKKGFGLCLLASLVSSAPWNLSRDSGVPPALLVRQDDPTVNSPPSCAASCELSTCGSDVCSASGGGLQRRSFDGFGSILDGLGALNISYPHEANVQELSKRIWRFSPTSNTPVGNRKPTNREVDRYLPLVWKGEEDTDFGHRLDLVTGFDDRAVSQQRAFGSTAFQIMSGGVHGCQVLTLVSTRGVWMAHVWEIYSNRQQEEDTSSSQAPWFNDRILKFIRGEAVTNPAPSDNPNIPLRPYIAPSGPNIDRSLFDDPSYKTKLFISSPIKFPKTLVADERTNINNLRYRRRADEIVRAFRDAVGWRIPYELLPYQALNTNDAADRAMENRNHRGLFLFQYDPNSDNKGARGWRYFAEFRYYIESL